MSHGNRLGIVANLIGALLFIAATALVTILCVYSVELGQSKAFWFMIGEVTMALAVLRSLTTVTRKSDKWLLAVETACWFTISSLCFAKAIWLIGA